MTVLNILASSEDTWKHKRKAQLGSCHSPYSKLLGISQVGAKFFNDKVGKTCRKSSLNTEMAR